MTNLLITFYQAMNRIKHQLLMSVFGYSSVCRHQPRCSDYARLAFYQHGTIGGLLRSTARVLTCW